MYRNITVNTSAQYFLSQREHKWNGAFKFEFVADIKIFKLSLNYVHIYASI